MNNFAVLNIAYSPTSTTLPLIIETNNPCHLTCYYTDKEPLRHRTSRNQRGLTLPWGVYYCFVSWQSVEQLEPGDTLTHTFEIPDWSYCQTKWFAFRGTVAEVLSPSVSCLFKYHHPGPIIITTEEQLLHDTDVSYNDYIRPSAGQRLTIPNRIITKLAFILRKVGSPTGIVYFQINSIATGFVLASKVLGDASALQTTDTWEEVTFDTPVTINEEVKIYCHHQGGDPTNYVVFRYQASDVKEDEYLVYEEGEYGWFPPGWYVATGVDAAYRYTFLPTS